MQCFSSVHLVTYSTVFGNNINYYCRLHVWVLEKLQCSFLVTHLMCCVHCMLNSLVTTSVSSYHSFVALYVFRTVVRTHFQLPWTHCVCYIHWVYCVYYMHCSSFPTATVRINSYSFPCFESKIEVYVMCALPALGSAVMVRQHIAHM